MAAIHLLSRLSATVSRLCGCRRWELPSVKHQAKRSLCHRGDRFVLVAQMIQEDEHQMDRETVMSCHEALVLSEHAVGFRMVGHPGDRKLNGTDPNVKHSSVLLRCVVNCNII